MQSPEPKRSKPSDRSGRVVLATMALATVSNAVAGWTAAGWPAATASSLVILAVLVAAAWREQDPLLARLLVFGLAAGLAELPADHFGVVTTQTLVYAPGGGRVWDSPLYMPLGWMIALTQLGWLAWWLSERFGLLRATLAIMVLGSLTIPSYELQAKAAGYWFYRNCPMLFDAVPHYVILAEILLSMALPLMVVTAGRRPWPVSALLGLGLGAWILLVGKLAWEVAG
jgi:hypothetical protein